VESRALVSETLLAGAESTEVLSSLGDNIIVEVEVDATRLLYGRICQQWHDENVCREVGSTSGIEVNGSIGRDKAQ